MRRGLLVLAGLLATACAGYSITGPDGQDGYVIYEPEPYVLVKPVYADTGQLRAWQASIEYLPNRSRPYRVRAWAGLGKGDFTFDYANGWMLTRSITNIDNTEVLKAIAGYIPKPADIAALRGGETVTRQDAERHLPQLYRVEWDCQGRVCGLTEVPYRGTASCP